MINPIYQEGEELLLNPLGSKYLVASAHTYVNSSEFVVQEDSIISVLTGGDSSVAANDIDYKSSMGLSGVTLKQGALIVAPRGESFQSMTIDSGSIMAYNSISGGVKPSGSVPLLPSGSAPSPPSGSAPSPPSGSAPSPPSGSAPLLLDTYPNASAAYSLRKLRNSYAGDAIKVRRSSDNTEQDIGFSSGQLDTSSLLSFVGSGDGFVTVWYDQSGNSEDASDSNANSQASIVLSGVLNTTNGNTAALGQSNSGYTTGLSTFSDSNGIYSTFAVSKLTSTFCCVMRLVQGTNQTFEYFNRTNTTLRVQSWLDNGAKTTLVSQSVAANSDTIFSFIRGLDFLSSSINSLANSSTGLLSPRKNTDDTLTIMGYGNNPSYGLDSYFSEAIMYPNDQSSNRVAIETEINNHYTIY